MLNVPLSAVSKSNLLYGIRRVAVILEVAGNRYLVREVFKGQDQIIVRTGDHDIGRKNVRRELDNICLSDTRIVVIDRVLTPATVEAIDVGALATREVIITSTALQLVVA
ncbi:hypothetical protein ALQ88_200095 [Pseudomonas savastanoi]|nr:hypothetical protein ALQ88_200095 [Pseudomonas savastanoi]